MDTFFPTVEAYIESLPSKRRELVEAIRSLITDNLPEGYAEGIEYGMIAYYVPLSEYPKTYNGQPLGYISIASNKDYVSVYLMSVYGENGEEFRRQYKKTGKKLDMGKSCVRFTSLEGIPTKLLAETVAKYTPKQFIELYESTRH